MGFLNQFPWSPETNVYVFLIDPYPGSHLQTFHVATLFPSPINNLLLITFHPPLLVEWSALGQSAITSLLWCQKAHTAFSSFDECTPVTMHLILKVPAPAIILGEAHTKGLLS